MKYRAAYGKIFWVTFTVVAFSWEIYLQSLNWVKDPIISRLRAIIFALFISALVVLLLWIQDKLSDRRPLYHHLMPQYSKTYQAPPNVARPNYAKVFKLILGITTLIYSTVGAGVYKHADYPLAFILACIIGGVFSGSILGSVVVLIMWIVARSKRS